MAFNKTTFLPAVTGADLTVRIVDAAGHTKYLIKEPDAILSLEGRSVLVRQRADTDTVVLDFPTPRDAREAMAELQQALAKLRSNKPALGGSGGGAPQVVFLVPDRNLQTVFNIGFEPGQVDSVVVNGQVIDNVGGFDFAVAGFVFNWHSNSFGLEIGDTVALYYYPTF